MTNVTKVLEILGDGIELIGRLVKNKNVDDAAEILDAVERAYDAMLGPITGTVDPDDARKELARLRADIDANDTAADAALDAKFPPKD
ncbi:hypothetical protein LCGC14_1322590, partial [marine sediment metagenome]